VRGSEPLLPRLGLLAVLTALALTACGAQSHAEEFGKISIPGRATIALEAGVYGVFYEEIVNLDKYDSLNVPKGLDITVAGSRGAQSAVFQRQYTGNHVTVNKSTAREIGTLTIAADGRYMLTVASNADAAERASHHPAITLGHTYEDQDRTFTRIFLIGAGLLTLYVFSDRTTRRWRRRSN
jgi:hypothetical protein